MTYKEWCKKNNCPYNCEHPQPSVLTDGRMKCWFDNQILIEIIPCECK